MTFTEPANMRAFIWLLLRFPRTESGKVQRRLLRDIFTSQEA